MIHRIRLWSRGGRQFVFPSRSGPSIGLHPLGETINRSKPGTGCIGSHGLRDCGTAGLRSVAPVERVGPPPPIIRPATDPGGRTAHRRRHAPRRRAPLPPAPQGQPGRSDRPGRSRKTTATPNSRPAMSGGPRFAFPQIPGIEGSGATRPLPARPGSRPGAPSRAKASRKRERNPAAMILPLQNRDIPVTSLRQIGSCTGSGRPSPLLLHLNPAFCRKPQLNRLSAQSP